MNKLGLAKNIAQSLTLGAWSSTFLETSLIRRLPPDLRQIAPALGKELITALPALYAPSPETVATALMQCDKFDRVSQFCRQHNAWPDPDMTSPVMAPIAPFSDLEVPQIPTENVLADWLFLPTARLDYFADPLARFEEHEETAVNHYHYVLQHKKTNGKRVIEAPKQTLKSVQHKILRSILDKIPCHTDAFGFVKGRNCLDAATRHTGEKTVVSFDLKDFFPSIGSGRVLGLFRCLGYPRGVARHLTAFCTTTTPSRIVARLRLGERDYYQRPHLPQGSPASPSLANQVAFTLDRRLSGLAGRLGANYSRYADDLSFSGEHQIVGVLMRMVPQIIREEGFCLNVEKTRVMSHTSRQVVTGVVVNQHLNVSRAYFDQLKAIIHACGKSTDLRLNDPRFRASLIGKIEWVEAVNPRRGQKLHSLLSTALANP